MLRDHFAYHAVPTNAGTVDAFRHNVLDLWRCTLRRRSQKDRSVWARMTKLADAWLPKPSGHLKESDTPAVVTSVLIRCCGQLRQLSPALCLTLSELTEGDLPKCSFENLRRHVGLDFARHRKEAV